MQNNLKLDLFNIEHTALHFYSYFFFVQINENKKQQEKQKAFLGIKGERLQAHFGRKHVQLSLTL